MERPMPDPLLLTAGKLTRKVIAPVHEAHLHHRLVNPLLILRVAVQKVRQHDIFIHSQHRNFVTFSWENQTFFRLQPLCFGGLRVLFFSQTQNRSPASGSLKARIPDRK